MTSDKSGFHLSRGVFFIESPGNVREVMLVQDNDVLRYVTDTDSLSVLVSKVVDILVISVTSFAVSKSIAEEFGPTT